MRRRVVARRTYPKNTRRRISEYNKIAKRQFLWATEAAKDSRYAQRQAQIEARKGRLLEAKDWTREAGVGRYWAARRRKIANLYRIKAMRGR